ncbi:MULTISPECIES: hypothetical protein [Nocardiopsis]|uniref:Uncharacterized protein n=1 Tax=Nocardiopsis sinuspersici TaxID=501010 RepID=A0A1V3C731_9ACTN|nr:MULTISPECIES: hypothetical protein [Nocardiopsis]NYH52899.1 hypothetical protein [Nocardiopsis sinuspersici]OOC56299.1 hypothetical protein NOSIN_22770 [Nocardiopsis sinuspersici]
MRAGRGGLLCDVAAVEVGGDHDRGDRGDDRQSDTGAGLVDRARVDGDGRAFQLRLTRKGRRVYFAASATLVEVFEQVTRENTLVTRLLATRTA